MLLAGDRITTGVLHPLWIDATNLYFKMFLIICIRFLGKNMEKLPRKLAKPAKTENALQITNKIAKT